MEDVVYSKLFSEFTCCIFLSYYDYKKYVNNEIIEDILAVDDGIYFYRYLRDIYNKDYYYILVYNKRDLIDIGFTEWNENNNSNVVLYKHYNIVLPMPLMVLTIEEMEKYKYG